MRKIPFLAGVVVSMLGLFLKHKKSPEAPPVHETLPLLDDLPVFVIVTTSNCVSEDLDEVINYLLEHSKKQSAELAFYEWSDDELIEDLKVREVAALILVDTLVDLTETSEVLNALQTSKKLAKIPLKTLTSMRQSFEDKNAGTSNHLDEMMMNLISSKIN